METPMLIRLAITALILLWVWFQLPRFARKVEDAARESDGADGRPLSEDDVDRRVTNAKNALLIAYAVLVLVVWIAPLPF